MNPALSIVIPAYNEADRVGDSLEIILAHLAAEHPTAELIVVDDGSRDQTAQVAEEIFARHPQVNARVVRYEENQGKGYAVRTGLLAACGEVAVFSDADLSTPITELAKLVEPIQAGEVDAAFGSRALDRSLIGTHQPWRREQSGKIFNFIVRTATGLPFWDTQCGFKAFRMPVFRPLLSVMQIDRFGFDVEFLFVSNLAGLRLREVPVRWNHCDGTKVSVFRDSRRMFDEVRQIRRNARRGVYDDAVKAVRAESSRRQIDAGSAPANQVVT